MSRSNNLRQFLWIVWLRDIKSFTGFRLIFWEHLVLNRRVSRKGYRFFGMHHFLAGAISVFNFMTEHISFLNSKKHLLSLQRVLFTICPFGHCWRDRQWRVAISRGELDSQRLNWLCYYLAAGIIMLQNFLVIWSIFCHLVGAVLAHADAVTISPHDKE